MAAEYISVGTQDVLSGQPVLFTDDPVPCTQGLVFHQNGSGLFLLASRAVNTCGCRCNNRFYETLYKVDLNGNVTIPEGGTLNEIQLQLSIGGELDPSSLIRITPAALGTFVSYSRQVIVAVPNICRCTSVSFRNVSPSGETISIQNPSIIFTPAGVQAVR